MRALLCKRANILPPRPSDAGSGRSVEDQSFRASTRLPVWKLFLHEPLAVSSPSPCPSGLGDDVLPEPAPRGPGSFRGLKNLEGERSSSAPAPRLGDDGSLLTWHGVSRSVSLPSPSSLWSDLFSGTWHLRWSLFADLRFLNFNICSFISCLCSLISVLWSVLPLMSVLKHLWKDALPSCLSAEEGALSRKAKIQEKFRH